MAKKLTRLTLEQLSKELAIIDLKDQRSIIGGYKNDCFWRCVSWMANGDDSEAGAAGWANSHYIHENGYYDVDGIPYAQDHYNRNGAVTSWSEAKSFYERNPNFSSNSDYYIAHINPPVEGEMGHAVVVTGKNPDGTLRYYDPQKGEEGSIEEDKTTSWKP